MGVLTNQLMVLTQIISRLVAALVSANSSFHDLTPNTLDLIFRQHIGMNHWWHCLSFGQLMKKLNNWLPNDERLPNGLILNWCVHWETRLTLGTLSGTWSWSWSVTLCRHDCSEKFIFTDVCGLVSPRFSLKTLSFQQCYELIASWTLL